MKTQIMQCKQRMHKMHLCIPPKDANVLNYSLLICYLVQNILSEIKLMNNLDKKKKSTSLFL